MMVPSCWLGSVRIGLWFWSLRLGLCSLLWPVRREEGGREVKEERGGREGEREGGRGR